MSVFGPLAPRPLPPPKGPDGKPMPGPPPITWPLAIGMAGAVLGSLLSNIDTRLTAFSLADLRGGIGYGQDEASWVSLSYNVAEVAVVPVTAWLASVISPRRAIAAAAILLTAAGALVPKAAPDMHWLVTLRFLQGLGGGALIPLLLLTVLRFTPLHQRAIGLTVYGFITAGTPLFAEALAGILTERVGWQSIFYISLPLGPLVVLMVLAGLPVEPLKPEGLAKADFLGMLLLAAFASTLTAALGEGQRLDWFSSSLICALFACAALLLLAFLLLELTIEHPLVDLSLFRRLNFSGGLLMIFAFVFASLVTTSIVPQYGMMVRGFREQQVGDVLVWAGLVQALACLALPALIRLLEVRVIIAAGLLMAVIAARLGTYVDSDWIGPNLLPAIILSAVAQVVILVPVVVVSTSTLTPKDAIPGGTTFNVVRNLAITLGGSVVTAILVVRERVHSFHLTDHLVQGAPALATREAQAGLPALLAATRIQATVEATADAFGWSGLVLLAAFLLVACLDETRIAQPPAK